MCVHAQSLSSCLTLCDPTDCSLPGSSGHGISQARTLEWVAVSFSGDLPNTGIKPRPPALVGRFLSTGSPGKSSCKVLIRNGRILCKGSWKLGSSLLKKARKQCTSDLGTIVPEGMNIRARKDPRQSARSIPSSSLGKGALLKTLEVAVAEW